MSTADAKYWCHECNSQVLPTQEFKCGSCNGEFVELMEPEEEEDCDFPMPMPLFSDPRQQQQQQQPHYQQQQQPSYQQQQQQPNPFLFGGFSGGGFGGGNFGGQPFSFVAPMGGAAAPPFPDGGIMGLFGLPPFGSAPSPNSGYGSYGGFPAGQQPSPFFSNPSAPAQPQQPQQPAGPAQGSPFIQMFASGNNGFQPIPFQSILEQMNAMFPVQPGAPNMFQQILTMLGGPAGNIGDYSFGNMQTIIDQLFDQAAAYNRGPPPAAKNEVDSLRRYKFAKLHSGNDGLECAVCKDEFQEHDECIDMPCKHCFHEGCLLPWLEMRNSCPVCRYELKTDDADYEKRKQSPH